MSNIAIVATDRKGCIGKEGNLPFPSDLKFFKEMTLGNPVIMGRKTWENLRIQPLPDRMNIVVSTKLPEGRWAKEKGGQLFYSTPSFSDALEKANNFNPPNNVFIIGGAKLYQTAFDVRAINTVIITRFGLEVEGCDCHFPKTTNELEKLFKRWKTFQIDNDVAIPFMRTIYTNEL